MGNDGNRDEIEYRTSSFTGPNAAIVSKWRSLRPARVR